MRATSVQSVVGEDRSDNHVNADTNQPSNGADREEMEFYDITASYCHICSFSVIPITS